MRTWVLIAVSACVSSVATVAGANPYDAPEYRSGDYAATAYYRVSFGGEGPLAARQFLGLKMANERADAQGAPALVRAEWTSQGALTGLSLTGLKLGQTRWMAQQSGDEALLMVEEADATCTGVGQPRGDCARDGFKRVVKKQGFFTQMFGDLGLPELITAAAAIGIVIVSAVAAGDDDSGSNTGAGP